MGSSAVRPHVPEEELHAYCDGELSPPQRVEIAEHLLGCLICRSQHAEVMELRTRTSLLLSIAAPRTIRPPVRPAMPETGRRRRLPRFTAAAAAAIIGVGLWFSLQPDRDQGLTQLAGAMRTPSLTGGALRVADSNRAREQALNNTPIAPAVTLSAPVAAPREPRVANAAVEVDPVVTPEWAETSWNDALAAGGGVPARVPGLEVASVRVHANADRTRPTFMVRQRLGDGHAIWVFEGLVDDIAPMYQLLQSSGIAVSTAVRVRTDYVETKGKISRPARMMVVVGRLPVDSLNALAGRVR